ncbi:hypothetical protein [Oceanobacillus salinisoli]|uniref:hypothetical protein n=1 Tax=Oceanobacillus salinisoli TaxID=2678611 RepID=UPI0012E26B21|nr:hypothetical protein [Oceanobacillus salinisoli]
MIVPIVGNVSYSITLDPTVWIFDERKILLEDAFTEKKETGVKEDHLKQVAQRFNRDVVQQDKPKTNKGITKKEGEEILKNSYVIPIHDFIKNAEIKDSAKNATFVTDDEKEGYTLPLKDLETGYLLFAKNGKPLKEDGPVHFLYKDGSNKDNPIKNIKKIVIN